MADPRPSDAGAPRPDAGATASEDKAEPPSPAVAVDSGAHPTLDTAHSHIANARGRALIGLSIAALGIVFGDIGTSPLYALRECFSGRHGVAATPENVLGLLSLIVYSLLIVITGKYVAYVLRADNRGEGGILSLMSLAVMGIQKQSKLGHKTRLTVIFLGLFGASMQFADGLITPAISVLSAVEGLHVATDVFDAWVRWTAVAILIALFLMQRRGTGTVGRIFGPITLTWFLSLAALGVYGIVQHPAVLAAFNPVHAVRFFLNNDVTGYFVLGSVFLVLTGAEALYADMGHFGKKPIRLAWLFIVLPALVLNYFGQGAAVLADPANAEHPFYHLAPSWAVIPLVGLATVATVVASQALISGAFSLTQQAVQLGYSPRFAIVHTSAETIGQIYVPGINRFLLVGVIALVVGFGTSSGLAAVYGLSVNATMVITTLLSWVVARYRWGWPLPACTLLTLVLLAVDLAYFGANLGKFFDGGWFALAIAASLFTLMTTWKRGRTILADRLRGQTFPLDLFLSNLASSPPLRVPGVAVFMTSNPEGTPPALMHNLKHNKVLHQRVVLLTISTAEVPHIREKERVEVEALEHGLYRVIARYGFMETPDVPELIALLRKKGLELRMMDTTFFLGRETLIPSKKPGMALWREALFSWMSRNAQPATNYFNLPPNRVVELGAQVEL
ncbi:MAG: potassium transporter Kup [Myxococcaceae bacterium]|nr:potassium transporter Kup [Myxococcaceae bacterium]